jgi:hypothetical protein
MVFSFSSDAVLDELGCDVDRSTSDVDDNTAALAVASFA